MSGHSKWSQIKHKKALSDAKKGKIFSKLARLITLASRQKGGDPETSPGLRMTIEKARAFNMPQENIERAIKRGTGEIEGIKFEEFLIEAYGPEGLALVIEGTTDNKNRTLSEIKNLLAHYQGKLAQTGSVLWLFKQLGIISVKNNQKEKEKMELLAIDAGAQDLNWVDEETLKIYTAVEDMEKVKKILEKNNIQVAETSLEWIAKNKITAQNQKDSEQLDNLLEELDENDDVNEVYTNLAE